MALANELRESLEQYPALKPSVFVHRSPNGAVLSTRRSHFWDRDRERRLSEGAEDLLARCDGTMTVRDLVIAVATTNATHDPETFAEYSLHLLHDLARLGYLD